MGAVDYQPDVSVITVVKNGERHLAAAIRSILAQTFPPMEILVVDGQSTDRTGEIARSFPQVRCIRQPGTGLAAARNLGIALARGRFIAFLDHDDLWSPVKLETQVRYMRQNLGLAYTTTLMRLFVDPEAGDGNHAGHRTLDLEPREGCTPGTLLARRTLFAELGGFDTQYAIGCDADWFVRARGHEVPNASVPRVLLYKRLHRSNLSANAVVNRREMFSITRRSIERRRRFLANRT